MPAVPHHHRVPLPSGGKPTGICAGPDGNLWFTDYTVSKIGEINPTTHAITEFATPTAGTDPFGITAGPDGNLWFTEDNGNQIGMINPTTHAISEFPVPTAVPSPTPSRRARTATSGSPRSAPARSVRSTRRPTPSASSPSLRAPVPKDRGGPDGNLWFTELASDKIGMINPTTHAITEFPVPTANAYPRGITAGPDGNLWFAEDQAGQVGMINPTTHAISEFALPTRSAAQWDHGGPRRQPLVHRDHSRQDR